jgi:thiol-disulfide isomerase/thioredoxin
MRLATAVALIAIVSDASAQQSASKLLNDLKSKRETLSGIHQEFESTQTFTSTHGTQTSRRQIIDLSGKNWRERSVSGAGNRVRIFDGNDLFMIEDEDDEYIRVKRKDKDKENDPEPAPYGTFDLDWAKAKELGRQPCGFATVDHTCIVFDVPVKGWAHIGRGSHITRMTGGVSRFAVDSENGLLIQSNTQETIDDERGGYRQERTFILKGMRYGKASDRALFALPTSGMREVKEFTKWNAGRIRKQLAGKPAPELEVTDIKGKPVSLSALKGKTVLLDFWTTWCPPCLADAPVLDDLYRRYADKNLMIVGMSVDEDRETVEHFLQKHAHNFPVVLTTENEMPRAYQLGLFPTYIVIDPNGTVNTAFDGDQGFGELRKHLAKAGTETH